MKRISFCLSVICLVCFVFTLNSCATLNLGPEYQIMTGRPGPNERVIDKISLTKQTSGSSTGGSAMGWPQDNFFNLQDRHPHEPILDDLFAEARRLYPNENIAIRTGYVNWGTGYNRYSVDIVTTDPVPRPVVHSQNITITEGPLGGNVIADDGTVVGQIAMALVTRGDMYRRAHTWLVDNYPRNVNIKQSSLDLGRIQGTYTFNVRPHQTYIITTTFTIDIQDAKSQIRFENTIMQRSSSSQTEQIFLQSIADSAHAEIINFTNNLIKIMTTP